MNAKSTLGMLLFLAIWTCGMSQAGLIAHYPLNGNGDDVGGNAINGNPTPTTDRNGNANSAMSFDGIDDHIDLGASGLLKPTSAVTLSLWAQNDNWSSFFSWAALAGNTSSGGYELVVHGGTGVFESEVNRNTGYGVANYPLSSLNANWHHFALTFDGRYNILYVDGMAVDTNDAGAVYPIHYSYPDNHTLIGAEAGTVGTEGDYFNGKIDDVLFYDQALSPAEIFAIFNGSVGVDEAVQKQASIRAFPNPASSNVAIAINSNFKSAAEITLVNASGGMVMEPLRVQLLPGEQSYSLALEGLAPGMYCCIVRTGAATQTVKIIHN